MSLGRDDYDAVPYPGFIYPHTHPSCLAVMGLLHGLDPAPVERCRFLDIGCNEASNIIPMAYAMPESSFTGFDLAEQPIVRAQQKIDELGLTNVRVFQADLMDVGDELGVFDYIIAHGVYAWVPEPVRDRLLALCRKHLAPEGIAFISYNALPGGHIRNLVRDILFQTGLAEQDSEQGFSRALQVLNFIKESRPKEDGFRSLLEEEAKQIQKKGAQIFYHDEMAGGFRPVSFTAFVGHATQHGLRHLSESVVPAPNDPCYKPDIARMAKALSNGDPVAEEQILDFVRMRMYRETLLCHAERDVDNDLRLEAFDRLLLASQAMSSAAANAEFRFFKLPGGVEMESAHPLTVLLMDSLMAIWPKAMSIAQAAELVERHGFAFDAEFLTLLLRLIVGRMVELRAWDAPVAQRIPERPRASATSRQEAVTQDRAATLLHTVLGLSDPLVRRLLSLLDGTRNRAELLQALHTEFPDVSEAKLSEGLEPSLSLLHRAGVLLAEERP